MAGQAGHVVKAGFSRAIGAFFEYDTPKIVHIRSKKVGIINRLFQLAIIAYIIGYAIVYKKGYQDFDQVVSAATTKLKGVVYTNFSQLSHNPQLDHRIFDVADYVVPPQENNAFFVMTNLVLSPEQHQGNCTEDPTMADVNCTKDSDCPVGEPVANGNGVRTGECNVTVRLCMIYAWCPVEVDIPPLKNQGLLEGSKKFTVLIKNNIEFPKFGIKKRNILEHQDPKYLQKCRYNKDHELDKLCPIFVLDTIVSDAGQNYSAMAVKGGVIAININWDCNLDFDLEYCRPEYAFRRLDPAVALISPGYNFRYANYYEEKSVQYRDLYKSTGIRFIIKVSGKAGKFSVVPLLLNIGSGLGLLAIATILCDIVVMYILKKGDFYKDRKYYNVTGDDAFQTSADEGETTERQPALGSISQPGYQSMDPTDAPSPPQKREGDDSGVTNRRGGSTARGVDNSGYTRLDT